MSEGRLASVNRSTADQIWVDKFAVRRDQRNRGIVRALLQVAFQRSFDRGYRKTSLSTDS